jgi:hypothetical protein
MGSVIGNIECPNCKSEECFEDYYYKTGEEYVNCPDCGYHRSFTIKRDEQGKMIKLDESKELAVDNVIREEKHIENPFGAYRVESSVGASCGTLETEEDYEKFVSEIVSLTNQENDIKEATVSRLVNGKIEKEIVFKK